MMMRLMILLSLCAAPVAAQGLMTAEEFDAYTQGKTLFYGNGGEVYGVERYMAGRRVVWSFLDGDCKEGVWYEQGGQICFIYEERLDPQCWSFEQTSRGLIARFEDDPEGTELYEAEDLDEEMICYGPDVGV
ncbi:hypothetical protein TRM7615_00979 [Falsiruegeria mediterranea M17]|uniref:Uncharacterized protein n=2 Tax=Falsiruegeria TaxID=2854184 RepID=A0A2R8C4X5_9RHOB|nr:hypothetical protein TRM7615_00979 [Falsiruegeria mediterranea M17]